MNRVGGETSQGLSGVSTTKLVREESLLENWNR